MRYTILIVDDEPTVLDFCCVVLRNEGYEVFVASDGREALDFLETGRPSIDLALLDVMMPRLNGAELAKRIGQSSPSTEVVFMSGYTPKEIKRLIGKDNADHRSIWKPFTGEALAIMIGNVLAKVVPCEITETAKGAGGVLGLATQLAHLPGLRRAPEQVAGQIQFFRFTDQKAAGLSPS